jgi:sugar/nucleoside kinase (ribokinase family)
MSVLIGVNGGLSIDHLVQAPVGARFDCLGGPGLYASLGARLVAGTDVRLHAAIPRSTPGFASVLDAAGIDLEFCVAVPDVPRVWILTAAQGRRLVPTTPPPGLEVGDADEGVSGEQPQPPPPFFDGLAGLLYCAPRTFGRGPAGVLVGVDPDQREVRGRGDDYWRSVAVPGGVLLPSRVQLVALGPDPRQAARRLATTTGVDVVARLDVEGIHTVDRSGEEWSIHDTDVTVVDTTGAGDASAGAIVAALAQGIDLPTAAAFGVSAARIVLSDWGHSALVQRPALREPLPRVEISRHRGA